MAPIFTGVARAIGGFGFGAASGPNDPVFMVATYPGSASDSTDGDYRTLSWTGSGAFVVTDAPAGANTIELMVIAGGGGGGAGGNGTNAPGSGPTSGGTGGYGAGFTLAQLGGANIANTLGVLGPPTGAGLNYAPGGRFFAGGAGGGCQGGGGVTIG